MTKPVRLFVATKAVLQRDGKVLVVRENTAYKDGINAGQYDIPGGRIDLGEHHLDGLIREVREETGLTISGEPQLFYVSEVRVPRAEEEWQIIRLMFACDAAPGPVALGGDHDEALWFDPRDYADINLIENLNPVFADYLKRFL